MTVMGVPAKEVPYTILQLADAKVDEEDKIPTCCPKLVACLIAFLRSSMFLACPLVYRSGACCNAKLTVCSAERIEAHIVAGDKIMHRITAPKSGREQRPRAHNTRQEHDHNAGLHNAYVSADASADVISILQAKHMNAAPAHMRLKDRTVKILQTGDLPVPGSNVL